MATTNFYLSPKDKSGKCFILLTYLANGEKFRFAVETKIQFSQWLINKQRVKVKEVGDEYLNSHLNALEEIITKAERESLMVNNSILFSFVKQRFNEVLNHTDNKKSFIDGYKLYIENSKINKTLETTKRYTTCLNHLLTFRKLKRFDLSFERINGQFYDAFISYLFNDCKLLNNTVGNYIKTVKSYMNYATDQGFNNSGIEFKKFKSTR
ncbi:MAG TPA: phage integrase SAM-like domain-containing protein, partial [Mucilaginibacter sp.]|nr:phage integrase SAM-like domain-containing protein [Mucilaginibacter sp.]